MPSSRESSQPRDRTQVSHITGSFYRLSHQGSPRILEWVAYPFSKGTSRVRNRTGVSCIAGGFFSAELPGKPILQLLSSFISSDSVFVNSFFKCKIMSSANRNSFIPVGWLLNKNLQSY